MSRWRPPAECSTAIITRAGFEKLRDELNMLWREKRPEVVRALSAAAAEGDRSENAEYQYRKKQLGEIDRRVRYLSRRLETVKVVDHPPSNLGAVFFGAWLQVENIATGEPSRYRIVGPDETDAPTGLISIDSPLARAALRKQADDEFEVLLPPPSGLTRFVITDVSYGGPAERADQR